MILTISRFDEVSPERRKQEYHQIAFKLARALHQGEYQTFDDAINIMASRMRVVFSAEDIQAIKDIALRIR